MSRAILIGYGSIGKRHLQQLTSRCEEVIVVDPVVETSTDVDKNVRYYKSLQDYAAALRQNESTLPNIGVIANWGPDHFSTFKELKNLGIRKFLVEKPLASRMSHIEEFEYLCLSDKLQIWSNFHLRFDNSSQFLYQYIENLKLGIPKLMTVTGGAKCLATTGIHWIDFFLSLSGDNNYDVISNILSENINPRNAKLSFLEGVIHLGSPRSAFNMVFTNGSYADACVDIYWKTLKVQIAGGKLKVLESENPKLRTLPITRTAPFQKMIEEMDFGQSGFDNLYDEFFKSSTTMPNLFGANKYLLRGLIYNDSAPISSKKDGFLREKDYLIS